MALTLEKLVKLDPNKELGNFLNASPEHMREFLTVIFEIRAVDRFIKDSPSFPGSTEEIIRDELVSVVGATLAIEGTVLNKEEIKESFRKADVNETLRRKEQESANSRKAYKFIIDYANNIKAKKEKFIYSEQLIRQIHTYITENMNHVSNIPGQYRTNFDAEFGDDRNRKKSFCRTTSDIEIAMSNLVDWLNKPASNLVSDNALIKAILAHYYLTEIHPFGDGNGRTARTVEALILYVNEINTYCFWSLANFWSANKEQYIAHLHNIRITCNPWDFLIWGLNGYLNAISQMKNKVLKKIKMLMLRDYVEFLLRNKKNEKIKINERIVNIVKLLINTGAIPLSKFQTSPEMTALYKGKRGKTSESTRWRDFKKMINIGLVKVYKEKDGKDYIIEPNFQILKHLSYTV